MIQIRTLRNDKGFTLVELAIVLVIIGILLGGIIKGQELIKNAKFKRLYSTYREVTAAAYGYYDKYGRYPGDDNTATARWATAANGNNNGFIDGGIGSMFCPTGNAVEACYAWQDLRLANLLTGSTDAATGRQAPTHPFGGRVALIRTSVPIPAVPTWNRPFAVCFENLSDEVAAWLDRSYDDGDYNAGTIRGIADYMGGSPDLVSSARVCIEG
jgi:prepilin-type N-terminal cleavage/methylation domain-containing protein